ncbi:hypothetical protein SpCBS45565_g02902 [Spizellomyces sp. 'palustris']|nr:hypothetical protein SpCBS45565_g02902 [Spizellomyces sp. 'palustris']
MASPRFRCPVSYKKRNGQLSLGAHEFDWTLDGAEQPDLRIPYSAVKAQAQNKSEKVILKVSLWAQNGLPEVNHNFTFLSTNAAKDRQKVIETLAYHISQRSGTGSGPPSASGTPQHPGAGGVPKGGTLSVEERQIRLAILQDNKELGELFKTLVLSNLISEEDFWATRQHLMTYQKWQKNQKKGVLGTIADVRPTDSDGSDMKFKITDDVIASILAQFPPVRKAYEANVPSKMTKETFMRKYLESKFYQRNRGPGSSASDAFFAQYEEEEDDDFAVHPKRAKYESSHLLLDLAAQIEDHLETGNRPDTTMRAGSVRSSLPLIRQFNRVSEGVLKANIKPSSVQNKEPTADEVYLRSTELDDLRPAEGPVAKVLEIADATKYFQSQVGLSTSTPVERQELDASKLLQTFCKSVQNWEPTLSKTAVSRANGDSILQQLNTLTKKRKREYQRNRALSCTVATDAMALHAAAKELLHNYWSAITEKDTEKSTRIVTVLQDILDKARNFDKDSRDASNNVSKSAAFKAMQDSVERAIRLHKKRRV